MIRIHSELIIATDLMRNTAGLHWGHSSRNEGKKMDRMGGVELVE